MYNEYDESPIPETPVQEEPVAKKAKKPARKRPHIALRALFQVLCFVLCIALMATLLATVLIADLRQLTSSGGIKQLVDALLQPQSSESACVILPPAPSSGVQALPLSDIEIPDDIPTDIVDDIPADILTGGSGEDNVNALIDWLYNELQENPDVDLEFTAEQFQSFVEESTLTDYVAEKLAGFAEDFINGTENTVITADELMALLEENEAPLKEHLNIALDEDTKATLSDTFVKVVEEQDLNSTIRETVKETVDEAMQAGLGMDVEALQALLQQLVSDTLLWILILICLFLVICLCLLNYYNIGAGFTWSAAAGLLAGGILSLPLMLILSGSDILASQIPELANVMDLLSSFCRTLAPLHYGLLIGSGVVFVLSIVWRCLDRFLFHSSAN